MIIGEMFSGVNLIFFMFEGHFLKEAPPRPSSWPWRQGLSDAHLIVEEPETFRRQDFSAKCLIKTYIEWKSRSNKI